MRAGYLDDYRGWGGDVSKREFCSCGAIEADELAAKHNLKAAGRHTGVFHFPPLQWWENSRG